MRKKEFDTLPIGTEVRTNRVCQVYGQLYPTLDHLAYAQAGSVGKLVSGLVPFVRCKGEFRCVDLPHDTPLIDALGKPVQYEDKHRNPYRIAVREQDINT